MATNVVNACCRAAERQGKKRSSSRCLEAYLDEAVPSLKSVNSELLIRKQKPLIQTGERVD